MRVSRVSAKFSWNCFIDFFPIFSGVGGGDSGIRSAETCFVKHLETRSCRVPAHIFRLLLRFKHCNVALVTRLVVLAHPLQALNNPPWLSMTSVCGEQSARSKIKGRPPLPPHSPGSSGCHQRLITVIKAPPDGIYTTTKLQLWLYKWDIGGQCVAVTVIVVFIKTLSPLIDP